MSDHRPPGDRLPAAGGDTPSALSRRELFKSGAALASGLPLAGFALLPAAPAGAPAFPLPVPPPRAAEAYRQRVAAAAFARDQPWHGQETNGDEAELPPYIASYSKALPHDRLGEVHPGAYALLLNALQTRNPRDFELVPLAGQTKLTDPQAALAFNLIGPDPAALACPPAPRFGSGEQAAELVELYWQALVRDVAFAEYESQPLVARAAAELDRLGGGAGRRQGPRITPRTVFRGADAGSLAGPYVSQFLCRDFFFSPLPIQQKIRTAAAGKDYLDRYEAWLENQNGAAASAGSFAAVPCYVRNGRDLAEFVHRDFSYQAALGACLVLLKMGAPWNAGNPYRQSHTQAGFSTFGAPHLLFLLAVVTQAALAACWYQKWMIHRRLRPEELGGRLENHLARRARYPLHETLLDSLALAETLRRQSSALLCCSYPEGCPTHPSYPAGHAVVSAAGTTVLKAFFDERFVIPEPVVASADGLSLRPFDGPPLTLGGELDKLAANVGMGRCFAGIHWRSDIAAGLRLGEEVAIAILRELRLTGNEPFGGFTFHRLDGRPVTA